MTINYKKINYSKTEVILENSYADINPSSPMVDTFIHECSFYKVFWIFIIGSIFGCYMEQIQYYFLKGIWESRAGVIWGPFSEVYGCGAILMFLLYYKVKNTSPITIFFTASFLGSAFEYFASLFQERFFASTTWNYSSQPFNIGGRTSLKYGVYWGLLGLVFIKWIFPQLNQSLERIKGKTAYLLTWTLIIFMSFNLSFSALAVNRWNERLHNISTTGAFDEFLDHNYGDDKMEYIFPHMKFINASSKTT